MGNVQLTINNNQSSKNRTNGETEIEQSEFGEKIEYAISLPLSANSWLREAGSYFPLSNFDIRISSFEFIGSW